MAPGATQSSEVIRASGPASGGTFRGTTLASPARTMRAPGLLAAALTVALVGACSSGGGHPDGGAGAAGSGTGGGAGTTGGGGTTDRGGATGGGGGGAGTTGTGGGAGATGGGGGIMNTGAAGNPGGCPSAPPTGTLISCTLDGTTVCNYPGESCGCRLQGAVMAWTCITCPASMPTNATACTPAPGPNNGGINCPYGNDFCACRTDNAWYCRCNGCP